MRNMFVLACVYSHPKSYAIKGKSGSIITDLISVDNLQHFHKSPVRGVSLVTD